MASGFLVPDRGQSFFRATSYRELLAGDELVWTVIDVVESLDLSGIRARYGVDVGQGGRPAFDPAMMVSLLVFGYCEGKRSARELEAACRRDVAYQAICGGMTPDHSTIARFRVLIDDVIESLFVQVLGVCAQRGLVDVGRVALDGTRMQAAASKESNRTSDTLAVLRSQVEAILAETLPDPDGPGDSDNPGGAGGADNPGGPGGFGDGGGGDLDGPGDVGDPGGSGGGDDSGGGGGWSRLRRMRHLQDRLGRIEGAQVEVERSRLRREHDEKRRGRKRGGKPVGNVTDPESRLQKTRDGFIQGYNAQAVVSGDQVVIAASVTAEATDVGEFESMVDLTMTNLAIVGVDPVGDFIADAGYWSRNNTLVEESLDGTVLLIAPGAKHHRVGKPPPPLAPGASREAQAKHDMATRLADPDRRDSYRQRGWLIEGCFAHTKTHRRTRRFSRRGLAACQAEWALIHLAGNILKIHQARHSRPGTPPPPRPTPPTGHIARHRRHRIIQRRYRHRHDRPQRPVSSDVKRHFLQGGAALRSRAEGVSSEPASLSAQRRGGRGGRRCRRGRRRRIGPRPPWPGLWR